MIQMTNDKKNHRHKHMSIVIPQSDFLCQAILSRAFATLYNAIDNLQPPKKCVSLLKTNYT